MNSRRFRWVRYLAALTFFLGLCVPRWYALHAARARLARCEQDILRYEAANRALTEQIERLESDPYYIEKVARETHGMMKDGEICYVVRHVTR